MAKFQNENNPIDRGGDSSIHGKSLVIGIFMGAVAGGLLASLIIIPSPQVTAPPSPVVAPEPSKTPEPVDLDSKKQLAAIVKASADYLEFSSNRDSKLAYGDKPDSYADTAMLSRAGLLNAGKTYCVITTNEGKGYRGFSQSLSGKIWVVSNQNVTPTAFRKPSEYQSNLEKDGCGYITDPNASAPYVDPMPLTTKLTFKCDVETTGKLPFYQGGSEMKLRGTETWSDGTTKTYAGEQNSSDVKTLSAGVTYQVTYEGHYNSFRSGRGSFNECLRTVDHWGSDIKLYYAMSAFEGAINLIDVPRYIPTSISTMREMFSGASKINDRDISKWDVSEVGSMEEMFKNSTKFNQDLSKWNVDKAGTPKSFASRSSMEKNPAHLPTFGLSR